MLQSGHLRLIDKCGYVFLGGGGGMFRCAQYGHYSTFLFGLNPFWSIRVYKVAGLLQISKTATDIKSALGCFHDRVTITAVA